MKLYASFLLFLLVPALASAETKTVTSPDGQLVVTLTDDGGRAAYDVTYAGRPMILRSALGLTTNVGDFTSGLRLTDAKTAPFVKDYEMTRAKVSRVHVEANRLTATFTNASQMQMQVTFHVSNHDVAFRYTLLRPSKNKPTGAIVLREATGFRFPDQSTTFLCPQALPMSGWERTKPSYEEEYVPDAPMTAKSKFGVGYTFPCLFRIGDDGWVQVSETGVGSEYCGSRLSDCSPETGYTVAYPQPGENNGYGSAEPGISLPGSTPWRTITVGKDLKPLVETTVHWDVVDPRYEPSQRYEPGRYTWSWLIWQDESANYDDQVRFIDLASAMGYEYILVDALWNTRIGRDRMVELSGYARAKGVRLLIWYNSNGFANDAPQGPRDCMNNAIARKREMKWLRSIGAAGIKVDFFGGDKQETMRLYEDILSDANDYGLQVIFHGCTLPRGWERMYPNYVASEGALASENVYFTDHHARREGFEMTVHPFMRNAVGSFDWGGIIMNRYLSKDNKSRHPRRTSDVFEMATGITNQTSVNCVALQPNNLTELPAFELDFLRSLPTTWDELKFIDGYPGKYAVLARRHGSDWYVAGLNGTDKPLKLTLQVPMLAGKEVKCYADNKRKEGEIVSSSYMKPLRINAKGELKVTLQPMGGIILK
ncbi:MAG: glycoside hydrolase family 97 protein [Prevotella sp.]|nr:glycoside hydrolase family 97 protein [Prevotella sp.]